MAAIPYYFCRYSIVKDDEMLDQDGQLALLREAQGQYVPYTRTAAAAGIMDTVLMLPQHVDGYAALSFSVGRRIGPRVSVEYDPERDRLDFSTVVDPGLHYADFVVAPGLGAMAVDDRSGPPHLGAKAAINRLKAVLSRIADADLHVEPTMRADEVRRALDQWAVSEFSYIVRPFNPHPPGDLAEQLSESFSKDNIGVIRGKARPVPGQSIHAAEDGHVAAAIELADAGYGQWALKGVTGDGHEAKIAQPKFEEQVEKNQRRQAQPRELKIIIPEPADAEFVTEVVKALVSFYGSDAEKA